MSTVLAIADDEGAAELQRPRTDRPWRRAAVQGSTFWAISHVLYAAVSFMAWRFADTNVPSLGQMLQRLAHWDAGAYVWVAEHGGYPPVTDPTFSNDPYSVYTVWPPGYPVMIWLVKHILPGVSVASVAVIVSNLAGLGMLIVLSRLLDREMDRADAERTVLYLIAFPTAFFFAVAYSESLFLLLAFASLYCARQGRWWAAGLLAAGAGATRIIGVLIGLALAYEYLRQREFNWRRIRLDVLWLALVPAGLGLYMLYLNQRYRDPLIFVRAQAFWGRGGIVWPWESIGKALSWTNAHDASVQLLDLSITLAVALLLVLAVAGPWRLPREQLSLWLFGAALFCVPLLTTVGPLLGFSRYALAILPAFMVLGKMIRSRLSERLLLFTMLPLQAILMIQFIRFAWAG